MCARVCVLGKSLKGNWVIDGNVLLSWLVDNILDEWVWNDVPTH